MTAEDRDFKTFVPLTKVILLPGIYPVSVIWDSDKTFPWR